MKRTMFAIVSLCFVSLFSHQARAQYTSHAWHNILTQVGRNDAIVRTAQSYADGYLFTERGGECKEWVRSVVYKASGNNVWIPANATDSSWQSHPYVGQYWPQYPARGNIIQMRWQSTSTTTTPHTMIVLGTSSSGISVIDCNWYNRTAYSKVYRHTITWADWYAKAKQFSVYYIK